MNQANVKIIFIGAICASLWGGYKIIKASYTALAWEKAEGTIIDFERNTWSCGKGISECYELIVGYHAGKNYYTINSDRKFNSNQPSYLLNKNITIYYSPANPADAVLSGKYGTMGYGITIFIIGIVVLIIFWFIKKRE